jgi:hypothetical protein
VIGLTWFFVTDVISSSGNWTNVVTLLSFLFFLVGLGFDGVTRPYGFWIHFAAGSLILGVFLSWWHTSDARGRDHHRRARLVLVGAGIRRSSYAVLGVPASLTTGRYAIPEVFPYFRSGSARATSWPAVAPTSASGSSSRRSGSCCTGVATRRLDSRYRRRAARRGVRGPSLQLTP